MTAAAAPTRRSGPAAMIQAGERSYSFEFFPPRPGNEQALWQALRRVEAAGPSFVSVTYGAGGSSRERTAELTQRIAEQTTLHPVAHLTAVCHSVTELRQIIGRYADAGVRDILALRGDPPGDPLGPWPDFPGGLRYAAELVDLVRSCGDFSVGVAAFPQGHPRSPDRQSDIRHFVNKCRAGADYAITQMFFRAEDYLDLRDRLSKAGCDIPVIPEIMPATSFQQISRFARLSNATVPPDLATALENARHNPSASHRIGVDHAVRLAERLLEEDAPGLHYITLNRSTAALDIHRALRPDQPPARCSEVGAELSAPPACPPLSTRF